MREFHAIFSNKERPLLSEKKLTMYLLFEKGQGGKKIDQTFLVDEIDSFSYLEFRFSGAQDMIASLVATLPDTISYRDLPDDLWTDRRTTESLIGWDSSKLKYTSYNKSRNQEYNNFMVPSKPGKYSISLKTKKLYNTSSFQIEVVGFDFSKPPTDKVLITQGPNKPLFSFSFLFDFFKNDKTL